MAGALEGLLLPGPDPVPLSSATVDVSVGWAPVEAGVLITLSAGVLEVYMGFGGLLAGV